MSAHFGIAGSGTLSAPGSRVGAAIPASMGFIHLAWLHDIAEERCAVWEQAGTRWEIVDGPLTEKPAAWLTLTSRDMVGCLIVWMSGEAEMEWGTPDRGGERHFDLDSRPPCEPASTNWRH